MQMNNDREYRSFELFKRNLDEEKDYIVEGYASTFEPYYLYTDENGNDINEQIARNAFDEADFSDCVFRVDHTGAVYARVSAGTVKCDIDDHGLHTVANLGKTQRGRDLYDDIDAGNYPKMSFAFSVAEEHFERATKTRVIDRIKRLYDISPVTWAQNPTTAISARSRELIDGEIKKLEAERLNEERCQRALERIKKLTEKKESLKDD